jgi:glutaryl-CoA dehydrogenase (non-decarboxylating)
MSDPFFTTAQLEERKRLRKFVNDAILPHAEDCDVREALPLLVIESVANAGLFGRHLGIERSGWGNLTAYGLLHEELARACSNTRSLVTVQDMVLAALHRWGTAEQRSAYMTPLTQGKKIAAFALSEVNAGSDASAIEATAVASADGYRLTGRKNWISFGEIADLFLIIARLNNQPTAFLVDGRVSGLHRIPIRGLLGLRASMSAEIVMEDCLIPANCLIGGAGCAMLTILPTALAVGRYGVAWGCVGMAQACLEEAISHASKRRQFGVLLCDQQLVQRLIADMHVKIGAARLLCWEAGQRMVHDRGKADLSLASAKYFASTAALESASSAVRIQGAVGCASGSVAARHFRDAKIMEIIEGSNEIQQLTIAQQLFTSRGRG